MSPPPFRGRRLRLAKLLAKEQMNYVRVNSKRTRPSPLLSDKNATVPIPPSFPDISVFPHIHWHFWCEEGTHSFCGEAWVRGNVRDGVSSPSPLPSRRVAPGTVFLTGQQWDNMFMAMPARVRARQMGWQTPTPYGTTIMSFSALRKLGRGFCQGILVSL